VAIVYSVCKPFIIVEAASENKREPFKCLKGIHFVYIAGIEFNKKNLIVQYKAFKYIDI